MEKGCSKEDVTLVQEDQIRKYLDKLSIYEFMHPGTELLAQSFQPEQPMELEYLYCAILKHLEIRRQKVR